MTDFFIGELVYITSENNMKAVVYGESYNEVAVFFLEKKRGNNFESGVVSKKYVSRLKQKYQKYEIFKEFCELYMCDIAYIPKYNVIGSANGELNKFVIGNVVPVLRNKNFNTSKELANYINKNIKGVKAYK